MLPVRYPLAVAAVAWMSIACGDTRASTPARYPLRLMMGQPGVNKMVDTILAALQALPNIDLTVQYSPGGVRSITAVQDGDTDVAVSGADIAYLAFAGQLDDSHAPFDRLRAIARLPPAVIHLLAGPHSGIHDIADLAGHDVSVGGPGSSGALTTRLILDAFGLPPSSYTARSIEFKAALHQLVSGDLDAMFVTLRDPDERLRETIQAGAYLVPITGAPLERLRLEYPFFKLTTIRPTMYAYDRVVHTTGIDGLLLCRRDLDESIVYRLTKQFFETVTSSEGLTLDIGEAPATTIPLHPGAAAYYREEELRR